MTIDTFIENFSTLVPEAQGISADTKFKELPEWSSLTALSTIAMVEDEYDVLLRGNDIASAQTLRDLFDIISSQQD